MIYKNFMYLCLILKSSWQLIDDFISKLVRRIHWWICKELQFLLPAINHFLCVQIQSKASSSLLSSSINKGGLVSAYGWNMICEHFYALKSALERNFSSDSFPKTTHSLKISENFNIFWHTVVAFRLSFKLLKSLK